MMMVSRSGWWAGVCAILMSQYSPDMAHTCGDRHKDKCPRGRWGQQHHPDGAHTPPPHLYPLSSQGKFWNCEFHHQASTV